MRGRGGGEEIQIENQRRMMGSKLRTGRVEGKRPRQNINRKQWESTKITTKTPPNCKNGNCTRIDF